MAMMTSILVPITEPERETACLTMAVTLAKSSGGRIYGLYARPDPRAAIPYFGEGLTGEVIQDLCDKAEEEGKQHSEESRHWFMSFLTKQGLPEGAGLWREKEGFFTDVIGQQARVADLTLVPQPDSTLMSEANEYLESALYQSGRAVMMVPNDYQAKLPQHILLAWDGSAESAGAISAAIPLLKLAKEVHLGVIGELAEDRPTIGDMVDFLHDHQISVKVHVMGTDKGDISDMLLSLGDKLSCDLLVMGAYSHSRLREMFLGGVTKRMITHAKVPVIFSH